MFSSKAIQRLEYCIKDYPNVTLEPNQRFYWPLSSNRTLESFRVDSGLDINDISQVEIFCAMVQIAQIQCGVNREDLYKLTLQALKPKSQTLSQKVMERMNDAYNYGVDMGVFNKEK